MAETRKPLNPLEREEAIGIRDGSDHAGEPVTDSRHGVGTAAPAERPATRDGEARDGGTAGRRGT
ncbi:hypothetical protein [Methylobacterium sp. WSM2598]|uniref:hypothetical protein n=1 Tax=Methylobacterium sp. WSM2598 TaxID=398261 RepID=UPI0003703EDD|nr:hypothetical protein [Methylobacterium sp. WSM2598]